MEQIGAFEASDYGLLEDIRSSMIDTDPVYALFTSGSTGVPKGAVICHKNILSYIDWYSETFGINEKTVFGNQTPFYFSMSVSDVFSTLKCGATLHIIPKLCFSFPIKLMEFMKERKVNTIYWVPSALCIVANYEMFKYAELPDLKKILFAGEVMPTRQLNYWIKSMPDAMFANLFGPTETTDICTYYVVDREFADDEPLPMGHACNNCDVFVVDEQGNLVAPDIDEETGYSPEGELYARGSFLAMGYYGNPEKTAEAFVQNPLNPYYPELVYKTGDLVKYNKYGELVYITRKDFQIKHMGYRIELGEIEAGAGTIQGIKSCACVYDAEVDKIVFVYEGKKLTDEEILASISARVPHYMVPNVVVRVKSMPHNQNGKIDRKLLQGNYKQYIK
jgi:acyl-coenzyme A synthetase/AMP-(fatty) acid ligase